MNKEILGSIISLIIATCIFGAIIWFGTQDIEIELPDLRENLCPIDSSLTKTNRVILFDFSDPLPEEYMDYPIAMVDELIKNEAEQFDRIILYTFNPYGPVPIRAADFCIPITMKNIPEEEKKVLWGKDPNINSQLPARFTKYSIIIKQLWGHEKSLNNTIKNMIIYLSDKGKNSQERSRLIENIEEAASIQKELGSRQTKITILSDMLQHTESYSHYKDEINFEHYLTKRESDLLNMTSFQFNIHYIQTCKTVESKDRERHKNFWKDYFLFSGAQYKFNFLTIKDMGLLCGKIQRWQRDKLANQENKIIKNNIQKNKQGLLTDDKNIYVQPTEEHKESSSNINSHQTNMPSEPVPLEPVPLEPVPLEPVPLEPVPLEPVPLEPVPLEPVPLDKRDNADAANDQEPAPETSNGFIQKLLEKH